MVDTVPPDKGCEVPDGELTHEYQDEDSADSDDSNILLKGGGVKIKCYEG